MKQVKLGLIGCGGNMRGHIRRLVTIPEVEIAGLVEPAAQNVARALELFPELAPVPVFTAHLEMLQSAPDAVVISTPHTLHARQILDALDAGAHVLVEKPRGRSDHWLGSGPVLPRAGPAR